MRDFIRFAYHSTDDRVVLGFALIIVGIAVAILSVIFALGVWIGKELDGLVGFMFVVVVLTAIACGIGYLLVEDARRAQIGDNAQDDA